MRRNIFRLLLLPALAIGACLALMSLRSQASAASSSSGLLAPENPGGSITIASSTQEGDGASYQTGHINMHTDSRHNKASWIGYLRAFTLDRNATGISKPADTHALWDAQEQLASLTDVTTQRSYAATADGGRYIFTYLDLNGDGIVGDAEIRDFVPASFDNNSYGILDVKSSASAGMLINYIRGDESRNGSNNLRNRTVDLDGDGHAEVMRLGGIINSTAIEVGAPAEAFDLLYGDKSYGQFRNQYAARRKVVYVGANDGMIHAFNAGFYKSSTHAYTLQGHGTESRHPLGSELWAYVPYNLLPHLKQLLSPGYGHNWYMDGKPRILDARIFEDDRTHPGGWGTILVMGMRFGGSQTYLDTRSNDGGFGAFTSSGASTIIRQQSAYVLMDVTDPEQKPTLIAEITDPGGSMGYTTSQPAIAVFNASSSTDKHWYLIFGSGPTLTAAGKPISSTSNSTAKLFVYDLVRKQFMRNGNHFYLYDLGGDARTGAPESFVGDPVVVDWDLDYRADALYFGTAAGSETSPGGKLFKLDFNQSASPEKWIAPVVLANPENPVITAPAVTKDEYNNRWVIAGTGRFYSRADANSTQVQSLFGVIDVLPGQTPDYRNFVEVSSAIITKSGTVKGLGTITSHAALMKQVQARKGWKRSLKSRTGSAAERSTGQISLLGGTLFATTFTPGIAGNTNDGTSQLYCLDYRTGTADANVAACGITSSGVQNDGIVNAAIDLGTGLSSSPALHLDGTASTGLSAFTQSSTGAITRSVIRSGPGVRSGEIDWREIHP